MKNSELTINFILCTVVISFVLIFVTLFKISGIKHNTYELPAPDQSVYLIQKDSSGWRFIREQQGAEPGSGVVTYSGYTDSIGISKKLKALIAAKDKAVTSKASDKELADLKDLMDKFQRKKQ